MHWRNRHTLNFPTSIRFGPGVADELAPYLLERGLRRPLLVTDKGLKEMDFFKSIIDRLVFAGHGPTVFSALSPNPVKKNVLGGKNVFLESRCDCVVAVGGGASMDVGRAIALSAFHERDLFDFDDALGGERFVTGPLPPLICVPTTSGTGSEVGRSAVISEDDTHKKRILYSPRLMAQMVFADPELTLGLPPGVTAATGMDALTHNTEAFLAKGFNPLCDGIALEALEVIAQSLQTAVRRPDLESRSKMMMASLMGAVAFQKGLGVVHSCAHPLSTLHDIHHGLANAIMLPHGTRFNQKNAEEKFKVLAAKVGAADFASWCATLSESIGLPKTLKEIGVGKDSVETLADLAIQDPCHANNPRSCSREDFKMLYLEAMG